MSNIAETFEPPYYAVIFTSSFRTESDNGYAEMSQKMEYLAKEQEGFLGIESAREEIGITISYWKNLKSIRLWHENAEHRLAQAKGYEIWYKSYTTRVCKVERDYSLKN